MGSRAVRVIVVVLVLLALALGLPHLFTGSSTLARALAWMESDIGDIDRFPRRAIPRSGSASELKNGATPAGIDDPVSASDGAVGMPLDRFLARNATRAFLVVKDDRLIYERYFNGGGRERVETSFSMAKSFASTLVGIAIGEGHIDSVDDPITKYLPELAERDGRFRQIRIRDLLTMSSGIAYHEEGLPWSDDAVTYYGTNLREVALERTEIAREPNEEWRYNNFHPLLLGLILERTTKQKVAEYMSSKLWRPLGAEADASWSLDSDDSGFEKMESGVNARARDIARFGLMALHEGAWNGRVIVPRRWMRSATAGDALGDPADFYGALWWVDPQPEATRDPFFARGKYGQLIAVVPDQDLVIVRLGSDDSDIDWAEFALDLAARL